MTTSRPDRTPRFAQTSGIEDFTTAHAQLRIALPNMMHQRDDTGFRSDIPSACNWWVGASLTLNKL